MPAVCHRLLPVLRRYKKRCLALSLWFLVAVAMGVQAQEQPKAIRTGIGKTDSAAITQLINKANAFQNSNPDSTIRYAQQAFLQSRQLNYAFGCGLALANMATAYRNKGEHTRSLALYREAVSFIRQQDQDRDYYLAAAYNTMFGVYFHLGMFDSAALNCYRTIALYDRTGSKPVNPKGSIVDPLIDAYQYLGICWMQTGYLQRSLEYVQKAEQRSRSDKHQYQLLSILANKSSIYCRLEQPEQVITTIEEARQIEARSDNYNYHALFLINLASALLLQGHTDTAIVLLQQASDSKPAFTGPEQPAVDAAFVLGDLRFRQGRYRQAIETLLPALANARRTEQRYNLIAPYRILAEAYAALGQHGKAYAALSAKEKLEDTMMHQAAQVMNMLDATLQSAEKDRRLSENQVRISSQQHKLKQQYFWIAGLAGAALLLVTILLLLYRNVQHKRLRQAEQLRLVGKEQEVQQLKAIMKGEEQERARFARELHDGFVSQLSAIRMNFASLSKEAPAQDAYADNLEQLEETIKELRKTAHNLMPEILLNAGLTEATQLYCDRINRGDVLFVDFRSYGYLPKLQPEFELPLYRMIQEALQNILKHSGATQAIVQFNYDDGILGITIEDNGRGFGPEEQKPSGTGLYHFKTRTESLGGHFHYNSIPGEGATLYFEFDLNEHES